MVSWVAELHYSAAARRRVSDTLGVITDGTLMGALAAVPRPPRQQRRGGPVYNSKLIEVRAAPTHCADCPIRRKALFQVVTEDYLKDAESRRSAQYHLTARNHLYYEGAPATMAFTLFSGWLLLYRNHSDGSRQGLRVALPGDFIGYTPLSEADYSHGALAVTDVTVCGFRQPDLHDMITRHHDLARQLTAIQARYLAHCENSILSLGRKTAEQRIAYAVAELYFRLQRREQLLNDGHEMPFPLTQEMLGEVTGLTPVHTNRVLRKLRGDDIMVAERQRVRVLDLQRLVELAGYPIDSAD
jgi:CRP-like cAMP-binding protein